MKFGGGGLTVHFGSSYSPIGVKGVFSQFASAMLNVASPFHRHGHWGAWLYSVPSMVWEAFVSAVGDHGEDLRVWASLQVGKRQAAHRGRGDPSGIGVPCQPPPSSPVHGGKHGHLDGPEPLGSSYTRDEHHGKRITTVKLRGIPKPGKEDETESGGGPRRRIRIHRDARSSQSQLLHEVRDEGWRAPGRCRGPHGRASVSRDPKSEDAWTAAVLRFRGVCAVCQEAPTAFRGTPIYKVGLVGDAGGPLGTLEIQRPVFPMQKKLWSNSRPTCT